MRGETKLTHDLAQQKARCDLSVDQWTHVDEDGARSELASEPREQVRLTGSRRAQNNEGARPESLRCRARDLSHPPDTSLDGVTCRRVQ